MPRRTIIVDLESVPHDCAPEFIPAPVLDDIRAAANLVDPKKIADDIAKRKQAAIDEHREKLSRAALDWNLSRIVALGFSINHEAPIALACADEQAEATALETFWDVSHRADDVVGFCARTFDLPTLIQRSRLLGVKHPPVNLARYGRGMVTDLRDVLTFDDARYEAIMPRSLKAFCKRFGIPVTDDVNGADIPQLVAENNWAPVLAHVTSDVLLTRELAYRLGVMQQPQPQPEEEPTF
jgi:hypothetical protein